MTELMITLVVLGIVIGLSVPSFYSMTEKNKEKEAVAKLHVILDAEKAYRVRNGTYYPNAAANDAAVNAALGTDFNTDLSSQSYRVAIGAGTANAFRAAAIRVQNGVDQNTCLYMEQSGDIKNGERGPNCLN